MDSWEAQLRRGSLELAILASLWRVPLYGLEILRTLKAGSGLIVTEGTIYPLLTRLREEGLVASEWVESDLGHPRRYYRLTANGRARVHVMEERWSAYSKALAVILRSVRETVDTKEIK